MTIVIQRAEITDLPALAEINRLAYSRETISMFAFTNWPAETDMFNFFESRLEERFKSPGSQIFKAVSAEGEILGFVCWSLEDDNETVPILTKPVPNPIAAAVQQMPAGLDMDFVLRTGAEVEQLKELMKGSRHYYVSTFVIPPKHQRHGIGSQLLHYCLALADQDRLPTWLISFPGSHSLYLRFGFEDVDYLDQDLNEWDKHKDRGFGIYRSYAMRRPAKELA